MLAVTYTRFRSKLPELLDHAVVDHDEILVQRSPFKGIGKPEPLRWNLKGFWSRRIDRSNRLVYAINEDRLNIISCKYHYE